MQCNSAKMMVFMKGTPDAPRCGFSRNLVEILCAEHIDFKSFDILEDPEVRQDLKDLSNWPTYPQVTADNYTNFNGIILPSHKPNLLGGLRVPGIEPSMLNSSLHIPICVG